NLRAATALRVRPRGHSAHSTWSPLSILGQSTARGGRLGKPQRGSPHMHSALVRRPHHATPNLITVGPATRRHSSTVIMIESVRLPALNAIFLLARIDSSTNRSNGRI